jgi:hypothetical protein
MDDNLKNLFKSGQVSMQAYRDAVAKYKQAAPAQSQAGAKAKAPLDIRPPAARNKPKPKHSKFAKRAGHNPPKPEHTQVAQNWTTKRSQMLERAGQSYQPPVLRIKPTPAPKPEDKKEG